jgi:putative NADH-flavin reductase
LNLLILGATGRIGGHLMTEALARGHAVTAFARTPGKLAIAHPRLTVVAGNVRDAAALAQAIPGHDAVISALGAKRAGETPDMLEVGMTNTIAAMQAANVRRLFVVASAGILQRDADTLRRDAPGYPEVFRVGSGAHLAAYQRLVASGLDWTVLCPPELGEGPAGPYEVLVDYLPDGPKRIAMASAAGFALDALEQGRYVRQRVGILDRPVTADAPA